MKAYLIEFLLSILLCLMPELIYSQSQLDKDYINHSIDKIRKQLNLDQFANDTNMSNAILELNRKYPKGEININSLRKTARKYFNYDYNIELVEVEITEEKELEFDNIKKTHKELYDIISDSHYNRIGSNIIEKPRNKKTIQFIASKNYIKFYLNKIKIYPTRHSVFETNEKTPSKILIVGETNLEDVYFKRIQKYSEIEALNHNFPGEKLVVDKENLFQIQSDFEYNYFVFFDESGKILSVLSYFIKE